MVVNCFTNPLQGNNFKIFRDVIMGYYHVNNFLTDDITIKERVKKVSKIKMVEKSTVPFI